MATAAEAGEIVRVVYHRGSQPGTVREIAPIAVSDDEVTARDIAAGIDKTFRLAFLELAGPEMIAAAFDPEGPVEDTRTIQVVLGSHVPPASQDDRVEIGLHDPLHAKLLGDSIEFIQPEAFGAPRVRQRFECHVEADLVPESKAVGNRASDAVDANGLPLDVMLLDAEVEDRRRDVDDAKRRCRNTGHTGATRNGDPDLSRELRPDVMEPQG